MRTLTRIYLNVLFVDFLLLQIWVTFHSSKVKVNSECDSRGSGFEADVNKTPFLPKSKWIQCDKQRKQKRPTLPGKSESRCEKMKFALIRAEDKVWSLSCSSLGVKRLALIRAADKFYSGDGSASLTLTNPPVVSSVGVVGNLIQVIKQNRKYEYIHYIIGKVHIFNSDVRHRQHCRLSICTETSRFI